MSVCDWAEIGIRRPWVLALGIFITLGLINLILLEVTLFYYIALTCRCWIDGILFYRSAKTREAWKARVFDQFDEFADCCGDALDDAIAIRLLPQFPIEYRAVKARAILIAVIWEELVFRLLPWLAQDFVGPWWCLAVTIGAFTLGHNIAAWYQRRPWHVADHVRVFASALLGGLFYWAVLCAWGNWTGVGITMLLHALHNILVQVEVDLIAAGVVRRLQLKPSDIDKDPDYWPTWRDVRKARTMAALRRLRPHCIAHSLSAVSNKPR